VKPRVVQRGQRVTGREERQFIPMKKVFLLLFTLTVLAACGDAVTSSIPSIDPPEADDAIGEQTQEVTSAHSAMNGTGSMMPPGATTWPASRFCVLQSAGSVNGSAGAPLWPNGKPKSGSFIEAYPPTLTSNSFVNSGTGTTTAWAKCFDNADYGITGGRSPDAIHADFSVKVDASAGATPNDPTGHDSTPFAGEHFVWKTLWSDQAFCYINHINSLNSANRWSQVDAPKAGTPNWAVVARGTATVGTGAQCVHPNSSAYRFLGTFSVPSGSIVWGPPVNRVICFFMKLGNLANGFSQISTQVTNGVDTYKFITGGTASATIGCVKL
jgi:hypothetical protein